MIIVNAFEIIENHVSSCMVCTILRKEVVTVKDFNSFTKEFRACFGDTSSVRKTINSDPHHILHAPKDGNQGYLPHNICMHLNSCLNKGHEEGRRSSMYFMKSKCH